MKDDTVVALRQPESFSDDPLTEILRAGARQLLGQAIEAEVAAHIEAHADLTDASGRRRIVRHGHMPEREVQTGIGAVTVKRPRVRDRYPQATGGRIRFTSSILPPYLRRAKSVEALLPWLYLKGISSGDFSEALAALLGPDAPGLTASTIGRLKAVWWDEYEAWQKRDLWARRYVYFWADGVYFSPRMDHDKQCVLVIIGADAMGNKDIVGMVDGYRESAQSWKELLLDLKRRGLETGPELAVGDGALGFWKALREVYGETRVQRCWVHKTANVLNQMPKSLHGLAETISAEGLFCALYTDRGSHYFHTPEAGGKVSKERLTQVGRALAELGIEHIAAYSPEARGRSERAFRTLQDRLVKELALAGIATVATANRFIAEVYLPEHNARFAVAAEETGSAYVPCRPEQWREVLCVRENRQVGNDNTVRWRGRSLQIPPSRLRPHFVRAKVCVHEYPDGALALFWGPHRIAELAPPLASAPIEQAA